MFGTSGGGKATFCRFVFCRVFFCKEMCVSAGLVCVVAALASSGQAQPTCCGAPVCPQGGRRAPRIKILPVAASRASPYSNVLLSPPSSRRGHHVQGRHQAGCGRVRSGTDRVCCIDHSVFHRGGNSHPDVLVSQRCILRGSSLFFLNCFSRAQCYVLQSLFELLSEELSCMRRLGFRPDRRVRRRARGHAWLHRLLLRAVLRCKPRVLPSVLS